MWLHRGRTPASPLRQTIPVAIILAFSVLVPLRGTAAATSTLLCDGHPATITGTAGDDVLAGTIGPDVIVGRGGVDTISGRGGNDLVCGGLGADVIDGDGGSDVLRGGSGDDQLMGSRGDDDLRGGPGLDQLNGGLGRNSCAADPGDVLDASCDNAAPVMNSFEWSTPQVSTGKGPATVTAVTDVYDDLTGVRFVQCLLKSPSGSASIYTSGTPELLFRSGFIWTYAISATLAQGSESGSWRIEWCYVEDEVHNSRWYWAADMISEGFPTTFEQTYAGDATPPAIVGLELMTPTVSTASAPATLTSQVNLIEDDSGIGFVQCLYRSPSGTAGVYSSAHPTLVSHEGVDWRYSLSAEIPRYAEQGTWKTEWCYAEDQAKNAAWYTTAQLASAGFPTTFEQLDPGDASGPLIIGFGYTSPSEVSVQDGPATITIDAAATDDLSGLHVYMACRYFAPNGSTPADLTGYLKTAATLEGTYALSVTLPRYSPIGVWTLYTCMLQDNAGNTRWVQPATLNSAGFPTTFTVT